MNNFLPSVRRLSTLASALVVGALAALAVASPANAHDTTVSGKGVCDRATGEWVITWTITNSQNNIVGKLTNVTLTPAGSAVTAIAVDAVLPLKSNGPLTGVQRLPATDEPRAALAVSVLWDYADRDDVTDSARDEAEFEGTCNVPVVKTGAAFQSDCAGAVDVTLTNDATSDRAANFVVTGQAGFAEKSTVQAGAAAKVTVPKASAGGITVTEGESKVAEGKWLQGAACLPVTGTRTGLIAGGGLALAGLGAVMFVLFRRRRVRFTAA